MTDKTNKLTFNPVYSVLLCLYVADPATFVVSNTVLGPCCPLRTAGLFTDEHSLFYYLINIVTTGYTAS